MEKREKIIRFINKAGNDEMIEFLCECIEEYETYIEEKNKLEKEREIKKSE